MKNRIFLIRNLMSIKAANAICSGDYDGVVYVLLDYTVSVYASLLKCIPPGVEHVPINSIILNGNFLKNHYKIKTVGSKVKDIFQHYDIDEIFITFPIHIEASVFLDFARINSVKVSFFEEGTCFYRKNSTSQYNSDNVIKSYFRKAYFNFYSIEKGYSAEPDHWYYSIISPVNTNNVTKINLSFEKFNLSNDVKYLFVSRPLSEDYSTISLDDEINCIKVFYDQVVIDDRLYIKFHPRELKQKKIEILSRLRKLKIPVEEVKVTFSSEELLYNMDHGAICGYETATLVYANEINDNVDVYSVADIVKDKEKSGTIKGFIEFYKKNFKHINYLVTK